MSILYSHITHHYIPIYLLIKVISHQSYLLIIQFLIVWRIFKIINSFLLCLKIQFIFDFNKLALNILILNFLALLLSLIYCINFILSYCSFLLILLINLFYFEEWTEALRLIQINCLINSICWIKHYLYWIELHKCDCTFLTFLCQIETILISIFYYFHFSNC